MKFTVNKHTTPDEMQKIWKRVAQQSTENARNRTLLPKGKGLIDPDEFAGKLKMDIDPVAFQRQVRNEWD